MLPESWFFEEGEDGGAVDSETGGGISEPDAMAGEAVAAAAAGASDAAPAGEAEANAKDDDDAPGEGEEEADTAARPADVGVAPAAGDGEVAGAYGTTAEALDDTATRAVDAPPPPGGSELGRAGQGLGEGLSACAGRAETGGVAGAPRKIPASSSFLQRPRTARQRTQVSAHRSGSVSIGHRSTLKGPASTNAGHRSAFMGQGSGDTGHWSAF